ncbi:MAG: SpoIVB peptidase [Lachnospiraceae bacterium]
MKNFVKSCFVWYQKHRVAAFSVGIAALFFLSTNLFLHHIPDKLYVTDFNQEISLCAPVTVTPQEKVEEAFFGQRPQNYAYVGNKMYSCKLFGLLPVKTIQVQQCEQKYVIPGGIPVGIYAQTKGVLVIGVGDVTAADGQTVTPAKNLVYPGDYITAAAGQPISEKEDILKLLSSYDLAQGEKVEIELVRNEKKYSVDIPVVKTKDGTCKLGIWVRDDLAGVGTLTFYDKNRQYAALGHCVSDYDTNQMLQVSKGKLYQIQISHIQKGEAGTPGELSGLIDYEKDHCLGSVDGNRESGIYGKLDKIPEELSQEKEVLLGRKQEIRRGKAQILSYVDGSRKLYEIEILDLDFQSKEEKDILFRVTDSRLIKTTGGIVQGMSGSPILQNGKLIGAVTHVFIRDPQQGYGIFADDMCN